MPPADFVPEVLAQVGPLRITATVVTTWGIMAVLVAIAILSTRRLAAQPGAWQTVLEGAVTMAGDAVEAVLPGHGERVLPFVGTLWIFIVAANLTGIVPDLHAPTADLSLTAALATLVFLSVHWYGIRIHGVAGYLKHYLQPNPIVLPFEVISEFSRALALAVRLFGNIFSLEMAAMLVLLVAGLLVPVPLLLLHVVEALVQAYIFGMLALIYIAAGIQSIDVALEKRRSPE
jgi:F-type H+-transporting ATPase subunit a